MNKILVLVIAVTALVIPSPATADIFLDNGEPIEEPVPVSFSGPAGLAFGEEDLATGMHCENIDVEVEVEAEAGAVTGFQPTNCTTTSPNPMQNGLPMDPLVVNLASWTLEPDFSNSRLLFKNTHINFKLTHPITKEVLTEWTLKGTLVGEIQGSTEAIETVSLSDEEAILSFGLPPSEFGFSPVVQGHLTSNGTIGIAPE